MVGSILLQSCCFGFSVIGNNMPIDSERYAATMSTSKSVGLVIEGAHKDSVCICVRL